MNDGDAPAASEVSVESLPALKVSGELGAWFTPLKWSLHTPDLRLGVGRPASHCGPAQGDKAGRASSTLDESPSQRRRPGPLPSSSDFQVPCSWPGQRLGPAGPDLARGVTSSEGASVLINPQGSSLRRPLSTSESEVSHHVCHSGRSDSVTRNPESRHLVGPNLAAQAGFRASESASPPRNCG